MTTIAADRPTETPSFGATAPIPFLGADVDVRLGVAFAQVAIEQRYRNDEDAPIEVTYAFPLAAAATLVSFEVVVGTRTLRAEAHAIAQAERRYEAAIADGDGAFLLRKVNDAVLAMALGNVRPGEALTVRLRYVEPHRPLDGRLRFRLPTVLGPHYGDPRKGGHRPEEAPVTDVRARYAMTCSVRVDPALADARIASPTHRIGMHMDAGTLAIDVPAFEMDRDLVLDIEPAGAQPAATATAFVDPTAIAGEPRHGVVVAGVVPAEAAARRPRDFVLLIDCSGSMAGDSIAQARRGAAGILQSLDRADSFRILRFGSEVEAWHATPQRATESAVREALARLAHLEADLGGTEIGHALARATGVLARGVRQGRPRAPAAPTDVLLITDGNSFIEEELLERIAASARLFCVGVGSAVSEDLLVRLARASGGACELVTPNEQMHETIRRQAERMATTRVAVRLVLEDDAVAREPMPFEAVVAGIAPADAPVVVPHVVEAFPGDPVLFTGFTAGGTSPVTLRFGERSLAVPRTPADDATALAALRVAGRIRYEARVAAKDTPAACAALAVRYGLVSAHTSLVAVDVREAAERTDGAPEIRVVPQMLAAGWGATSTVTTGRIEMLASRSLPGDLRFDVAASEAAPPLRARVSAGASAPRDPLDAPQFSRKEGGRSGRPGALPAFLRRPAAPGAAPRSPERGRADAIAAALAWLGNHPTLEGFDLATAYSGAALGEALGRLADAAERLRRIDPALARHAMSLYFLELTAGATDTTETALHVALLATLPPGVRTQVEAAMA